MKVIGRKVGSISKLVASAHCNHIAMKNFVLLYLLALSSKSFAGYDNPNYVNKCTFSEDGQFALASEFYSPNYFKFRGLNYRIPFYGLYKLGTNSVAIYYVAMSNDSTYFLHFSEFGLELMHNYTVDSAIATPAFLARYKLNLTGIDITRAAKLGVSSKCVSNVNNTSLIKKSNHYTYITKGKTKFYDHIVTYKFNGIEIFRDTIFNTYGNKYFLVKGLNDFERKDVLNADGSYRGPVGYPIRIYADSKLKYFFIRAQYVLKGYAKVSYLTYPIVGNNNEIIEKARTVTFNGLELIKKNVRTLTNQPAANTAQKHNAG